MLRIGLIFSTSGTYAALGRSALAGAMGAIEALGRTGVATIVPVIRDPGGDPALYERATTELLEDGVRHIVGAITSSSRKDMIPVLERHGGLLWYPCPYEGFENNDHVVYLGAAPNHHVLPAVDWIAERGMRRAYLVGSNYVWGWETLRLARERLRSRGIDIVGERFVPLGAPCPAHVVDEIRSLRADCVVDSLIGPSNASFLHSLADRDPRRRDRPGHVISFNQTEADLADLGDAADGLLSAGILFEEDAAPALRDAARRHAPNGRVSAFLACSYMSVEMVAHAVASAGTDDPRSVFRAVSSRPVATAMGRMTIDPVLRHAAHRPCLALAEGGRFRVIARGNAAVPADPYLSETPAGPIRHRPDLRLVR